ncbi:MAG: S23 ribosomal protein [Parcubacteria group bacterium GW2011_GWA2_38_13]|nr:MAG: S23 ribosomal protein [Parcubacteria group bacterium GW2011_GWA2_38_13]
MSKGSAGEVRNQLYIALEVNYINKEKFKEINNKLEDLAGQIGGLIVYLQNLRQKQKINS